MGEGDALRWRVRLGGSLPRGRYRVLLLAFDGLGNRVKLGLKL